MLNQLKVILLTVVLIICGLFVASMWYVILGLSLVVGAYYFAKLIRFIGGVADGTN